jgi:hypothetical protein
MNINKKFDIVDITNYDYQKEGGRITLKFDNDKVMRRYFTNTVYDYPRICSLSGKEIKPKEVCVRVTIKDRGYGQYLIKSSVVSAALQGKFKKVQEESDPLVKELRRFLENCAEEKVVMTKKDRDLRQAIREIKFKASKLGVKMSKANQLLEVLNS